MKSLKQLTIILGSLAAFLLIMEACNKDSIKNTVGKATLDFYLTDGPCDYDHIWIDIEGLEIHSDSNGWESITPFNDGIYDLLELSNGLDTFLGSIELPAGKISQIRLLLGDDNTLEKDGSSYDLKTPSGQQSGIKLNLHMDLDPSTSYTIWLDFDACKSIVEKGNGGFNLKPVIRAFSDSTNGKLKGFVNPTDGRSTVHAIHTTANDTFRAIPDSLGFWLIPGLDGTYDVWVDSDTLYNDTTITGVSVPFGGVVDMDTIQLN